MSRTFIIFTHNGHPVTELLLSLFIITMPMTSILAPSVWTPIPLIITGCMFISCMSIFRIRLDPSDLFMVTLLCFISVPWIWSYNYINTKIITHYFALLFIIFFYYILIREVLYLYARNNSNLFLFYKTIYISTIISSIFIIFEAVSGNFYGIEMSSIFTYTVVGEYDATILGIWKRSRGFAEESGHMALFYDLAIFLCIPYIRKLGSLQRWLSILIIITSWALLFSAASFVAVCIAMIIYLLRVSYREPLFVIKILSITTFALAVAIWNDYQAIIDFIQKSLVPKLALIWLDPGTISSSERLGRFLEMFAILKEYPLGIGFGVAPALAEASSSYNGHELSAGHISLIALFGIAGGVPGILLIGILMLSFIWRAWWMSLERAEVLGAGVAVTLHYIFVGNFWLPFLWFFWALVVVLEHYDRRAQIDGTIGYKI